MLDTSLLGTELGSLYKLLTQISFIRDKDTSAKLHTCNGVQLFVTVKCVKPVNVIFTAYTLAYKQC